jgi:hypothetical protein
MTTVDLSNEEQVSFIVGCRNGVSKIRAFTVVLLTETEKRTDLSPVQQTATGLLDRASCWLATLEALTLPQHYQGHLSAFRSMMEVAVDLALLCIDPARNAQLEAWELSAKFKHASNYAAYAKGGASNRFLDSGPAELFTLDNGAEVNAARAKYWNGRHPNRWTGNSLLDDVKTVDGRFPKIGLLRIHEGLYRYLCFMIHGSALAGRRGLPADQILTPIGVALYECSDLALACAELAQRLLGRFDAAMQVALKDAHTARTLAYGGYELVDGEIRVLGAQVASK